MPEQRVARGSEPTEPRSSQGGRMNTELRDNGKGDANQKRKRMCFSCFGGRKKGVQDEQPKELSGKDESKSPRCDIPSGTPKGLVARRSVELSGYRPGEGREQERVEGEAQIAWKPEAMPRSRRQSLDKQQQQHAHSRLERVSAAASSAASDGKPRQHKSSLGPGSENDRRSNLGMAPATVAPQD